MVISGGFDGVLGFYKLDLGVKKLYKGFEVGCSGVVNCIDIDDRKMRVAVAVSGEHRLGRWIQTKDRSVVKIFKF